MWLKAILFLVIGLTSATFLWLQMPTVQNVLFLVLTIWAFCRSFYFGFYALEKYVDPQFKFAGLTSLARYIFHSRRISSK